MTEDEALAILRGDDAAQAAGAEAALWTMWCHSGTPEVDALLLEGVRAMQRRELVEADAAFTRLIARAPEFAEGWNKRATVRYLAGNYDGSIADCRETLDRKPHHFGALSGQALCHLALGQHRAAAAMFRRALEVHPHLAAVRHNLVLAVSEAVKGNGHSP
jgi:tetratricopeptide (TPR) repeat protein